MGYSAVAEFPSVDLRDQVMELLEAHLTPIHTLVGEGTPYVRGPDIDPSYKPKKNQKRLIGFDFNTSMDLQSRVAYRLCYWMARQIPGVKLWYDGLEPLEIPEDCDENGFCPLEDFELRTIKRIEAQTPAKHRKDSVAYLRQDAEEYSQYNPAVKAQLERLTAAWKAI